MALTENLADHTKNLYEGLYEYSHDEEIDGQPYNVFRGSIVDIYTRLGISRSYYSQIVAYLSENGCISYLQKGGRSVESVIILHHPPTFEGIELEPLTGRGRHDRLEARVKVLEDRLGGLDYVKIFTELNRRLTKLERKPHGKNPQE